MWTLIILYILGLNTCQTTGEDNSTQMYYVKLIIEESAIGNITARLTPFVNRIDLKVDNLKMTTICQSVPSGTKCSCQMGFIWSDRVCQESNKKCCGNKTCTFTNKPAPMCVSEETVFINGSITLNQVEYYKCLEEKASVNFKQCNNDLLQKIKTVYSTMAGFDILTISKYRVGSVITDFNMTFAYNVKQQALIEKSKKLGNNLSASVDLETKGVVRLIMPKSPVCYYDQPKVRCVLKEDLKTLPVWQLKRHGTVFEIFTGTESEVSTQTLETRVTLKDISELWAGEYTCLYYQKSDSYTITHKASSVMDISLLPKIDITMTPAFPRCRGNSDLRVRVKCGIESNNDTYDVKWISQHTTAGEYIFLLSIYAADIMVSCDPTKIPQLTCTFKNRCNEERNGSAVVNVIYAGERFCPAEGEWEDTKAGFRALLKCTDTAGYRERNCKRISSTQVIWEPEVSTCVKQEVNDVRQKANIVDIGLGALDKNAANVFSLLQNVTRNSTTINTFANMNASVEVLVTMRQKIDTIHNKYAVDDFLESSSNMLEKSLNKSWITEEDKNVSLAERYLDSMEHLIQMTNLTNASMKNQKNLEVAVSKCTQGSKCHNTVFNNSVEIDSLDPGEVKTAGFKELENYLPNKDETYKPNSIIVSTTTESKQLDSIEVKIRFSLLTPRPPNVDIKCVSWDNYTRSWSQEGCKWKGVSDEGLCVCTHLSSFAILMSRHPVDIGGLTELTYVGLSISIISLILTIAIELIVWSAVVKTNTLYLRHTAHINICLCLLVADLCFLASFESKDVTETWSKIFVLLKHFCYLSMFFWMLCLSCMLLHQAIFLFHNVSRSTYLRISLVLGYVCPFLITIITFVCYNNGAEGEYYSKKTGWLLYVGLMKGSIHTFVIPVGIITIFNLFSMVLVITKLLNHPKTTERYNEKDKAAAVTVLRSVILLTPIFGLTWLLGFAVMLLDLTSGVIVSMVHYSFNLLNTFQGLFILLTTCLADKMTRDAVLKLLKKHAPASITDSTTKLDSTQKK
ncbi:adhesion G protein-coupled receptor F5 [Anoplopoma fimbria]|uniref:adhesion G protein-coupled receptor F5 n=1 Tax=Anoplopoma fimbria TaxID=229290 RepID=UPI0023EACDF0|nr:adhesion G protein-coupled receptor F5 [Anoplopoma fimbria]